MGYRPRGLGALCSEGALGGQLKLNWAQASVWSRGPPHSVSWQDSSEAEVVARWVVLGLFPLVGQLPLSEVQASVSRSVPYRVCLGRVTGAEASVGWPVL